MRVKGNSFLLCVLMVAAATTLAAAAAATAKPAHYTVPFNRTLFPRGFVFGAGSSAYQSEGAANIDGKGPSIWDTFTKQHPEKISDQSTGDVADDFYHRYKSDVQLMKKIGLDSFRFSLSWSRIFPEGRGKVNALGVKFYNNVINELLANGMISETTLTFASKHLEIGLRIGLPSMNPTYSLSMATMVAPLHLVGVLTMSEIAQSATPALSPIWSPTISFFLMLQLPDSTKPNIRYAHSITYGDYPEVMRAIVGDRLPKFSEAESKLLKGSYDFLGLNYYTANYVENSLSTSTVNKSYTSDIHATFSTSRNGLNIGTPTALSWLYIYPKGLRELLVYVKNKYQNPTIYITENGVGEANNASKPVHEAIKDSIRIRYHDSHLRSLLQAIKDGVNVKGYYAWSFMDDFEWDSGYTPRFGLTYVDYKNNLKRYLKYSAFWFKMFLLR
ncbi:vicianin hydrolase-like isoform X2 [Prosopis cineraria]|uniref:vicianin hydrolase-like isoform X2 n=1 Tax=Prosopis cineraria TaxID=364024 RepID=UPI0024104780|nr:vicianin hydrolase-like isoform X2 [Prosopis cineraria]